MSNSSERQDCLLRAGRIYLPTEQVLDEELFKLTVLDTSDKTTTPLNVLSSAKFITSLHEHTQPVISALSDKVLLFNFLAFGKHYLLLRLTRNCTFYPFKVSPYCNIHAAQSPGAVTSQASPSTFLLHKYTLTLRH